MVRTQVYLTEQERSALLDISRETGKKQSELIREAIDRFIEQFHQQDRKVLLKQAKGIWKGRKDLPDFTALRLELDRTR